MKKHILFAALLSISIFFTGCSNDYYVIEKHYYRLKKEAGKIFNNPFGSPPRELERVVGLFKDFSKKYPNNNLSLDSEFEIARLYAVKEEYAKARDQLKAIGKKYSNNKNILAEVIYLTGNTYQAQDNWPAALEQYRKIISRYPATLKGLRMPMYIAAYYRIKHQPDKMMTAYQEAAAHYISLKSDKDLLLDYLASRLLGRCYTQLKDWESAVSTYNGMLTKYSGKIRDLDSIIMEMALIYEKELKQKDKAREMLSLLTKDYPRSRYRKLAASLLKEMSK